MAPRPRGIIRRAASRTTKKLPDRLTCSCRSQSSSSSDTAGPTIEMPALLNTAETGPRVSACSNAAATWRESVTSAGSASAADPVARHSPAAASRSSPGSATSATAAPSCASRSAVARPIPELAPVTTQTRSAKRAIVIVCSRTPFTAVRGASAGVCDESGIARRARVRRRHPACVDRSARACSTVRHR